MAHRSYFQRIAEPVRLGDPLLFAMPRAAPDEARPPAVPPAAATTVTPSAASVLRRAPARAAPPLAPAALPATPSVVPATPSTVPAIPSAQVPAIATPANAAPRGLASAVPPPAAAPAVPAPPPGPLSAAEPGRRSASVPAADVPASPGARREETAATDFVGPPSFATGLAAPAPAAAELPSVFRPAPRTAQSTSDGVPGARSGARHAEPVIRPPASLAAPPSSSSAGVVPPRIHIGTVEVRSAAPVLPHAAPGSAAAPISRGYAWRFGLVQG